MSAAMVLTDNHPHWRGLTAGVKRLARSNHRIAAPAG